MFSFSRWHSLALTSDWKDVKKSDSFVAFHQSKSRMSLVVDVVVGGGIILLHLKTWSRSDRVKQSERRRRNEKKKKKRRQSERERKLLLVRMALANNYFFWSVFVDLLFSRYKSTNISYRSCLFFAVILTLSTYPFPQEILSLKRTSDVRHRYWLCQPGKWSIGHVTLKMNGTNPLSDSHRMAWPSGRERERQSTIRSASRQVISLALLSKRFFHDR